MSDIVSTHAVGCPALTSGECFCSEPEERKRYLIDVEACNECKGTHKGVEVNSARTRDMMDRYSYFVCPMMGRDVMLPGENETSEMMIQTADVTRELSPEANARIRKIVYRGDAEAHAGVRADAKTDTTIRAIHRARDLINEKPVPEATASPVNSYQVGGEHYGLRAIQHWDIVAMFDLDYFQGQITKYVMRWQDKNGIEDLKKAAHYLEKYIEIEEAREQQTLVGDQIDSNMHGNQADTIVEDDIDAQEGAS